MSDKNQGGFMGGIDPKKPNNSPKANAQKNAQNAAQKSAANHSASQSAQTSASNSADKTAETPKSDIKDKALKAAAETTPAGKAAQIAAEKAGQVVGKAKDGVKDALSTTQDAENENQPNDGRKGGFLKSLQDDDNQKADKQKSKKPKESAGKKLKKWRNRAVVGGQAGKTAAEGAMIIKLLEMLKQMIVNVLNFLQDIPIVNFLIHGLQWAGHMIGTAASAIGHAVAGIGHGMMSGLHAVGGAFMAGANAISHGLSTTTTVGVIIMSVASAGTVGSGAGFLAMAMFGAKDAGQALCTVKQAIDSDEVTNIDGVNGAWTQKGTKSYNLAKQVYAAAIKLGMDSTHAAGIVGNAMAEGGANGQLDQKENDGSGLGGQGIYQFTPGDAGGHTLESYLAWCAKNNKSPWSSALVETEGILAIKDPSGDYKKTHYSSPADAAKGAYGHLENSVQYFYQAGQQGQQRMDYAQKAYNMFNGELGTLANGEDDASQNDATAGNSAANANCDSSTPTDSADGTGTISENIPASGTLQWKYGDEPDDIKQYVHDPKDVGMSFGSQTGWTNPDSNGQCVPFADSYFSHIWGVTPVRSGNGKDQVNNYSHHMSGKISKTPHAGDIASADHVPVLTGSGSEAIYGHTFVVEHVLANGDFIVAEQNYPGVSGFDEGKMNSWNYAVFSKKLINTGGGITFFTPSSKYKLNWNNK